MLKKYKLLTGVLTKANAMDDPKDRGRKIKNIVLSIFALVFVMIPVVAVCGIFTFLMTKSLMDVGKPGFGIELMYGFISIFTVIFGINVIFNELYFSSDIEHLLPLPLRAWEIAGAKFTAAFLGENVMQFMMVLSCTIGFGLASKMNIFQWIFALIGSFLLPLAPMAVLAILGILLMCVTGVINSKDKVRRLSLIIMLAIFAVMALTLTSLQQADIEHYIIDAAAGDIAFVKVLHVLFPEIQFLADFMAEGSIVGILLYLVISAALVGLFIFIAEKMYLRSVTGLSEGGAKAKVVKTVNTAKKSPAKALFDKEMKELMRTQVFFTNCIAITFAWPIFVFVAARIMSISMARESVAASYGQGAGPLIFAFVITVIMTSMNSLGSNAFSREGKGIDFLKYIPVELSLQWNVKAAISIVISAFGTIPYMIIFAIYAKMSFVTSILMVLVQFLAVVLVTYMGMLLDSNNPKLVWEDALSALRENYNTFFCMAISIVIAAVVGGLLFLGARLGAPVWVLGVGLLVILAVADMLLYKASMTTGLENIREIG